MEKSYKAQYILLEECETSENGGHLGRFPSGYMQPEFERALYRMKVGAVSLPVKTKFGYHIILKFFET